MENYRNDSDVISYIKYHILFCTRYRRVIFNEPTIEERFKEKVTEISEILAVDLVYVICEKEHVHILLIAPPSISATSIVAKIKSNTSRMIRDEFGDLIKSDTLWTRNYLVSTRESLDRETVTKFLENQKKRG